MIAELYYGTGFDAGNIPDNVQLLRNNQTGHLLKTYTDINVVQTEFLAVLTVELAYEDARSVDFVVLEDKRVSCYTVASFEMLAADVCRMVLVLEPFSTMGGLDRRAGQDSKNKILACNANRMHVRVSEDDSKFFNLAEPFQPALRSVPKIRELIMPLAGALIRTIIETLTIPPKYVNDKYDAAVCASDSNMLVVPKTRKIKDGGTEVSLYRTDSVHNDIKTNTIYWIKDSDEVINDMRITGRDNEIVNIWEVPSLYVRMGNLDFRDNGYDKTLDYSLENPGVEHITNAEGYVNIPLNNLGYSGNIYNKKVNYSQAYTIVLFCPASGDKIEHNLVDVLDGNNPAANPTITIYYCADIRPGGTPLAWFKTLNGVDVKDAMIEEVKGAVWRTISLATEGGSYQTLMNARERLKTQGTIAKENYETNKETNTIGTLGGVAGALGTAATGNVLGAVGQAGDTLLGSVSTQLQNMNNYSNTLRSLNTESRILFREAKFASTPINIGDSSMARDCSKNGFSIVLQRYADDDMKAFDTFLTRWGYNVGNKEIDWKDFYSRQNYNYIRVNDIVLQSENGRESQQLYKLVKEELKIGVRIWHTIPSAAALMADGNPRNSVIDP